MFSTGRSNAGHQRRQAVSAIYGRHSVPTRRLSMRRIKEVLRLRFELGLGQREIARACAISQGAVHNYLKKVAAAGISWPLPEGWDEKRVEQALFGEQSPV